MNPLLRRNSFITYIVLWALPILLFAKNVNGQCAATAEYTYFTQSCSTIQFSDLSTTSNPNYTIIQWDWDFGDGNTANIQNPTNTFTPGASYNVTLTVTADSSGVSCTDDVTHVVTIDPLPTVSFTWDPEPTCLGSATSFTGISSGNIATWSWDFGDGGSSNIQNPLHVYLAAGTYTVTLTITDVNGCTENHSQDINVVDPPDVDFTIDPNPVCFNSPATFTGSSSGNISSWYWDFGDGFFGNSQTVVHTYAQIGTFNVTLTITEVNGCTNSITYPVTVNSLPIANFTHTAPACLNDTVFFNNFSTTPNGNIETWVWDFGDGNATTVSFPDDPNVSHLYANAGTYQASLTVTDSDGCVGTITKDVIIIPNPTADFTYLAACFGDPVDFTDLSSQNGGTSIVNWSWEFDDPASGSFNTSNLQNPSHVFTAAGTYNVFLQIANADNCIDTVTKPVIVDGLPDSEFTMSNDTVCLAELVQFTATGTGNVAWNWDFGDGGTSFLQNPEYAYLASGDYVVSLTVTDNNGCQSTTSYPIHINQEPSSIFTVSTPSCANDSVYFTSYSTTPNGYITTWHWYFGDGNETIINFPSSPNVAHLYSGAGTYNVSLVITDSDGCIDSTAQEVTVVASPIALFEAGTACDGSAVQFTDLSVTNGGTNIVSWFWNFGDPLSGVNNTSTLQNPVHIFTDTGYYTVTFTAFNTIGCSDTISQQIYVNPLPEIDFTIDNDSSCVGSPIYFTGIGDDIIDWSWDFGDGSTSNTQNPMYIYNTAGTYTVTLTGSDANGCENSVSYQVWINDQPLALYNYTNNCYSDTTRFYDESVSNSSVVVSWFWDFDDPASAPNDTSSLQNPVHVFSQAGTYYVSLIVTDFNGCADTIIQQIQVNDIPQSDFVFDYGCIPYGTVNFYDESEPGSNNANITEWLWEIDEGYFSTEINPTYTYNLLDTCYHVTLTVTDMNGCSHAKTDTVCLIDGLSIDFTATKECATHSTFFDASYLPADDSVVSWIWNFGDGSPAVSSAYDTISYTYPGAGIYNVVLTAENEIGCTTTIFGDVVVDSLPSPDFIYANAICDQPTLFYDQSYGNGTEIISWEWNFGDYSSGGLNYSTNQNPSHVYGPEDSTYFVTLAVTNFNGCQDSIQLEVTKDPCVVASFEAPTELLCVDYPICFTETSTISATTGVIVQWEWDFGDGNTLVYNTFQDPVCHTYDAAGVYEVTLLITANVNTSQFTSTVTNSMEIRPTPTADFAVQNACLMQQTIFSDSSLDNGMSIASWRWDFGDHLSTGDTSLYRNPTYLYSEPGLYDVELIVTNGHGCANQIVKPTEVFTVPTADFSFSNSCYNQPTYFYDESDTTGNPVVSWLWGFRSMPPYGDTSTLVNPIYTFTNEGFNNVHLIVTDINGCMDTMSQYVQVNPVPQSAFAIHDQYDGVQGQVLFENLSSNFAEAFLWNFDNGVTSEEENPIFRFEEDGTYIISLIAYNIFECPDTSFMEYDVFFKGLYIPNALAPRNPNEDIQLFTPKGINLKQFTIEVFSKWGNLVWRSTKLDADGSPTESWDGTYRGELLPQGTYVWKARGIFKDDTIWEGQDKGNGVKETFGVITLIH